VADGKNNRQGVFSGGISSCRQSLSKTAIYERTENFGSVSPRS